MEEGTKCSVAIRVKKLLDSCRSRQLEETKAAEPIKELLSGIHFGVESPGELFTGRNKELEDLHRKLSEKVTVVTQATAIGDHGGIGKSELVRQYVQKHSEDYDGNVVWINAENGSTLSESFRQVATTKLGLSTKISSCCFCDEKDIDILVKEVYQAFEGSRCLFIFDNAGSPDQIRKYLVCTQLPSKISFLIISGKAEWKQEDVNLVEINELDLEEATTLVKMSLPHRHFTDESIQNFVEELHCFPLALQQALAYIKKHFERETGDNYDLTEYCNALQNLVNQNFHQDCTIYERAAFATCKLALEKIPEDPVFGSDAIKILTCLAYLCSDNVEYSMLLPLTASLENMARLKMAVRYLAGYNVISEKDDGRSLSIHRLVQHLIRAELSASSAEESTVEMLLNLMSINDKEKVIAYLDQALSVWSHAQKYERLVANFSLLPSRIVEGLREEGRFAEGNLFGMGDSGLGKLNKVLSGEHENSLKLEYQLCVIPVLQGKYDTALPMIQELLERMQKCLGEMHNYTLLTEQLLAATYHSMGEVDKALELYLEGFEKMKVALGLDNSRTVDCIYNASQCWEDKGQHEKAMECYEKSIEMYVEIHDRGSLTVVRVQYGMAKLAETMGNFDKALKMYGDEVYPRRDKLSDRMQRMVCYNFACVLNLMGHYEKALKICEEALGENGNARTGKLFMLELQGTILRNLGRYDDALTLQEEVYLQYLKEDGEDAADTLWAKAEMAETWACKGYSDEAIFLLEDVISKVEKKAGKRMVVVVSVHLNFARLLMKVGRKERSVSVLDDIRKKVEERCEKNMFLLKRIDMEKANLGI